MKNIQEKNFIQDILKVLLLSRQQVQTQNGMQETQSVFENILNNVSDKFKIDDNLVSELQIEFNQYIKKNKEKILFKVADTLTKKVGEIESYNFRNIIGSSQTLKAIIERKLIDNKEIQDAIAEIKNRDFPELSRKIKEGKVEIRIIVNLK